MVCLVDQHEQLTSVYIYLLYELAVNKLAVDGRAVDELVVDKLLRSYVFVWSHACHSSNKLLSCLRTDSLSTNSWAMD